MLSCCPVNVLPSRYQIWLQPNFTEFSFSGEETIDVEVMEPTSQIQLNSVEIEIQSATLSQGGNSHPASEISFDTKRETVTPELQQNRFSRARLH